MDYSNEFKEILVNYISSHYSLPDYQSEFRLSLSISRHLLERRIIESHLHSSVLDLLYVVDNIVVGARRRVVSQFS